MFGENGEPLVFIHPPLMGHVVFKYQRHLQLNHQVVLYDMRGHGHSTYSPSRFTISRHLEDIRELLDHLHLSKATLVGYSAGGSLAMEFALRYPDRTSGLILSGGFPKVDTWLLKQEFNIGIALMKNQKVAFLSKVLALSHKMTATDKQELFRHGNKANPDVVLNFYVETLKYNCIYELKRLVNIPTLVLYGTRDFYINAHAKWFEKYLPTAKIVSIDRGTHQLPTRFHEPFNHAIAHFLHENI